MTVSVDSRPVIFPFNISTILKSCCGGPMSRIRILLGATLMLALVCLCSSTAFAQYGASLQGTITDKSGAVISGATVTVTNQETGVVTHVVSGDSGFYRVSGLVPGHYTVKAEAPSFKTNVVTNISVAAEDSKGHDVVLEPGPTSESVTVTAEAVALQTENGSVTGTITAQDVQRLP